MMYRVTNKRVVRNEGGEIVVYEEGDEFEPTDDELAAFDDRLEEVDTRVVEMPDLEEMTVDDAEEALETGEYDGVLDRLEELEESGEDRQGVYDAIERRRG